MPKIIVTDPVYVRDATEYQVNIIDRQNDANCRIFLRIPVSEGLLASIADNNSNHRKDSPWSDESFFAFGREGRSLEDYRYIGWHGSDSGMTCIVRDDSFSEDSDPSVDATEFILATIQDPEMQQDLEEFPLYQWFARIPEAASSARIYAYDADSEGNYQGLLIRSGEDVLSENEQDNLQVE